MLIKPAVKMKILKIFVPIILLPLTVYYCATVPITGRSQLNLISSSEMNAMSFELSVGLIKQQIKLQFFL